MKAIGLFQINMNAMKNVLCATFSTMIFCLFAQGYEDLHLDFNDPEVLVGQIETALTNGVPCSVVVTNISLASSFQPVSALGACLDFDLRQMT